MLQVCWVRLGVVVVELVLRVPCRLPSPQAASSPAFSTDGLSVDLCTRPGGPGADLIHRILQRVLRCGQRKSETWARKAGSIFSCTRASLQWRLKDKLSFTV